jgi:hypothetical protein
MPPAYLSPSKAQELTDLYKKDGSAVWNHADIKTALLDSSGEKCAYCECSVAEESKYLEVEHFLHKDAHEDLVVEWKNLLPACKRCNGTKGDHDVVAEPIINPFDTNPRQHIAMRAYRFRPKTALGKDTIEVLGLNESKRLVRTRFGVGELILGALDEARCRYERWIQTGASRSRSCLVRAVEAVLLECQPSSVYAATAATVLHGDEGYALLRTDMQASSIWTAELEELHEQSEGLVLALV